VYVAQRFPHSHVDIVAQREPRQQCEAQRSLEANWANGNANPTSAVEIKGLVSDYLDSVTAGLLRVQAIR